MSERADNESVRKERAARIASQTVRIIPSADGQDKPRRKWPPVSAKKEK